MESQLSLTSSQHPGNLAQSHDHGDDDSPPPYSTSGANGRGEQIFFINTFSTRYSPDVPATSTNRSFAVYLRSCNVPADVPQERNVAGVPRARVSTGGEEARGRRLYSTKNLTT